VIPPYYDSLMAKLIAQARRPRAGARLLLEALEETEVEGVETNGRCSRACSSAPTSKPARSPPTGWSGRSHDPGSPDRDRRHDDARRQSEPVGSGRADDPGRACDRAVVERVGYHACDFTSSTHMAVSVRFHQEDPWERIRLVSAAMPATPLSMIGTGMRFISWVPAAEDLIELSFRAVARNGIRRFQIADPSNDPERLGGSPRWPSAAGSRRS
jgi:acetyl/propionyl-CoA carboxylase alpha subunit